MSTDSWVLIPLTVWLFTPAMQFVPDDWYDAVGLFKFSIVYNTRLLLVLLLWRPLLHRRDGKLYLWDRALQLSTLGWRMLRWFGNGAIVISGDIDKLFAVRQENAIEALREFAKATGNTLLKSLKSTNNSTPDVIIWMVVLDDCVKWENVGVGELAFQSVVKLESTSASAHIHGVSVEELKPHLLVFREYNAYSLVLGEAKKVKLGDHKGGAKQTSQQEQCQSLQLLWNWQLEREEFGSKVMLMYRILERL
ncbi:hypothetical protein SELMODRAFT_406424 [Selaginella moellendorffii]|uniref:Uncharacterized protein n=1 Tax=Selaginella moellendorffii TaxID=88036 RepID=D8R2B7_SELML|nr:hypothetical protein SELMODRAFT_406424 [Selaginella moellendorffii]